MRLNGGNRWSVHFIISLKSDRDSNTPHRILVGAFGSNMIQGFNRCVIGGPGKKDGVSMSDGRGHVQRGWSNKSFRGVELRQERSGNCAAGHISDLTAFASAEGALSRVCCHREILAVSGNEIFQ